MARPARMGDQRRTRPSRRPRRTSPPSSRAHSDANRWGANSGRPEQLVDDYEGISARTER